MLTTRTRVSKPDRGRCTTKRGATEAKTALELTSTSDIVMLCMDASKTVESRMFGTEGMIAGVRFGVLVVDFGASSPESTKHIGEALAGFVRRDNQGYGDDTLAGAFLAQLLQTGDPHQTARYACDAAALTISGYGAVTSLPDRQAVISWLNQERGEH